MVKEHKRAENPYISQYIAVGPKGAALQIDREKIIDERFEVPNSKT